VWVSKFVCHVFLFPQKIVFSRETLLFFKKSFFIILQFYLCSKAQANLGLHGNNKGHFVECMFVILNLYLSTTNVV
jgi:hypothetical protein